MVKQPWIPRVMKHTLQMHILAPFLRRTFFKPCKGYIYLTFVYLKLIFDKVSSISLGFRTKFSYDLLGWAVSDFSGEWFFSKIALKKSLWKENEFITYISIERNNSTVIDGNKEVVCTMNTKEFIIVVQKITLSFDMCHLALKGELITLVNLLHLPVISI